ncbi:MAG TPA: flap endonuclease-1 [Candidatus Dormibacteraeota bacterium]|nr:flap endonuclease-1 [Candidatus Dormibacteraeota bacterium]
MGFNLSPIVVRRQITLNDLRGRALAVDANNMLYQFLALIRMRDGRPFTDAHGNVTSHLLGLLMRTTRLMSDYGVRPVFIFDGKPPGLKTKTLRARRQFREQARRQWEDAMRRHDYSAAWSKAVRMDSLTRAMQEDAKSMLSLLGIPHVQAPEEGEAQAAYIARKGEVWAANSRDYDSVLFGAPRLVRYVTVSGQEFLPSTGISRPLIPELIELQELLKALGTSRHQLVDLAILVGTDFNAGVRGVGPKTALKLVKEFQNLEGLPKKYLDQLPSNVQEIRKIFLDPTVTDDYEIKFTGLDEAGLEHFLVEERGFSEDRVELAVERMRAFYLHEKSDLTEWLGKAT